MDESVRRFLDVTPAQAPPPDAPFGSAEVAEYLRQRRTRARPARHLEQVDQVLEVRTRGGVPARVYIPGCGPERKPLVVYFHGGGWVTGDLDMHDPTCRSIAARSSSVVVNVDYRLAPEHPFPAPLDDCYEATQWAMENSPSWGADPALTILAGTSAGGNLAAAVAVRRRDAALPPLAGLLLLYPVLDARMQTLSYAEKAAGYFLTAAEMKFFWDAYVQDGRDRTDPWLSPGLAESLTGLPPSLVITAEHDPLRDEGNAFAARLTAESLGAGHLEVPGQIHGFLTVFPGSAAAEEAMSAVLDAIATMTAASGKVL